MSSNVWRIREIQGRLLGRTPRFGVGQMVREPYGAIGVIDCVYADLDSVIDKLTVDEQWYDAQERRPKTPKNGIWYGVVLPDGAVVVGEDDLELAEQPS